MNIQHSSRSDCWYTPPDIIRRVHEVFDEIDFDPASDEQANKIVSAKKYLTAEDDALAVDWGPWARNASIYLNPPGGKVGNRSKAQLFWDKLVGCYENDDIKQAIFMAFSLEQMQTTQRSAYSILDFPFCVPSRRVRFVHADGTTKQSPSHSNVIVYIPGSIDRTFEFTDYFRDLGKVVVP